MMDTIDIINITGLSKDELEDIFYNVAIGGFQNIYPEENIPNESVIIGKIYKNKKKYSCQIKLIQNNVICMCSYDLETRRFTNRFYRLESKGDCLYGIINKNTKPSFAYIQPRKEKSMSIFAKWEYSPETKTYKCSNCGYEDKEEHDNCPYCHFYMTEPREDNPCQNTESK